MSPRTENTRRRFDMARMRLRTRGLIHHAIEKAGMDAIPHASVRHSIGRRAKLLQALRVGTVIDVGANQGQFGSEIREAGYSGRIVSIEPTSDAFARLERRARDDGRWTAVQCALGASDGELTLHIAGNSASSSFLDMLPVHEDAAPGTAYVGQERVTVRRLESLLAEHVPANSRPYLKVDVQGYELEVLRGAGSWLEALAAIQLELSLARLYAAAPLADEVDKFITGAGYRLAGVEPGLADPVSGRLLQMDGIYVRADLLAELPGGAG